MSARADCRLNAYFAARRAVRQAAVAMQEFRQLLMLENLVRRQLTGFSPLKTQSEEKVACLPGVVPRLCRGELVQSYRNRAILIRDYIKFVMRRCL